MLPLASFLKMEVITIANYNDYMDLLSKSYEEAVECLLQKYGPAQDDYYREKSYQRFLNGEIKNITPGKVSRTNEGLYCHHIDEIDELKISDKHFIKRNRIPFEYQKKSRLVYCDLIEHAILHVLITKETSLNFGYPGYSVYLKPLIEEWYLDEKIPRPDWMGKCYYKSYLKPQDAFNIIKEMQKNIGESYYSSLLDYINETKKAEEARIQFLERRKQERINQKKNTIKLAKQLNSEDPRSIIVSVSYDIYIRYKDPMDSFNKFNAITFKEYESKMKKYTKEQILKDLLVYIEDVSELIDE